MSVRVRACVCVHACVCACMYVPVYVYARVCLCMCMSLCSESHLNKKKRSFTRLIDNSITSWCLILKIRAGYFQKLHKTVQKKFQVYKGQILNPAISN